MARIFLSLLLVSFVLRLLGVGIVVIVRRFRGRIEWSAPACAKCKYNLQRLDAETTAAGEECGANLNAARAVRFGRYGRRKKLIIAGCIITLLPMLFIAGVIVQQAIGVRLSQFRSNQSVLASIAKNPLQPFEWNELTDRHLDNKLSVEEISQAIELLITAVEKSGRRGGPLQSSFLEIAMAEDRFTDDQFKRLCAAYYASGPDIQIPA